MEFSGGEITAKRSDPGGDLALQPAGTFARLTELVLIKAWFHGPSALGDLVSSPRCPSLLKLVSPFVTPLGWSISPSTRSLSFKWSCGILLNCSTPQLVSLELSDPYVPSSIQLGNMELLQRLATSFFLVYGPEGFPINHTILELLTRFRGIQDLTLNLAFPRVIGHDQYLMEDITIIPRISFLTLVVMNYGHAFGASLFHVLKKCTGLRSLSLHFEVILEVGS
ncbi:hypothetical protein EJB05_13944, partial [Eragrostis curvula]